MIKTVELTGSEIKVEDLNGKNTAIYNKSDGAVYASRSPNITPNADGVIEIPAGGYRGLDDTCGVIYLLGTGKVELTGTDYPVNFRMPSSSSGTSGGGGGTGDVSKAYVDAQDSTNLGAAKAYTDTTFGAVKEDVAANANDISELQTGLSANAADITSLQSEMSAVQITAASAKTAAEAAQASADSARTYTDTELSTVRSEISA